jgi:gliding motility-associated-like protein
LSQLQYLWNTGDTTPILSVTAPGEYSLRVSAGPLPCSNTESITVAKDCYVDIPNAFTPNGDGENDYFLPRQLLSRGLQQFSMQIINRWGQVLFQTRRTDGRGWDGRFNGQDQPQGVYVYLIRATLANGFEETYTGNVTLLR